MTDNEVVKALECCNTEYDEYQCPHCPLLHKGCKKALIQNALDLINRLKEKNEKLEEEVGKEFTCFVGDPHKVEHCPYLEELETAKTEAYKEFAERLFEEKLAVILLENVSNEFAEGYQAALNYVEEQASNILKEMESK